MKMATLQQTLINRSKLASPWGLALAPSTFGRFGGDLLVGNFSFVASEINAFDPTTGAYRGDDPIDPGLGNNPGGLWGLILATAATAEIRTSFISRMASTARETDFSPLSRLPSRRAFCCLSRR